MAENCKVYNLESFTDEERERVKALIDQIECERARIKKYHEKALTELGNFIADICTIHSKLEHNGYIKNNELVECLKRINESRANGILKEVIKE